MSVARTVRELAVIPREVVNAVRGDGTTDAGVGSVVIVVVDPVPVGRGPGLVAGIRPGIGPFGSEGAIEPFDLPVRLWAIRSCAAVLHVAERLGEGA